MDDIDINKMIGDTLTHIEVYDNVTANVNIVLDKCVHGDFHDDIIACTLRHIKLVISEDKEVLKENLKILRRR